MPMSSPTCPQVGMLALTTCCPGPDLRTDRATCAMDDKKRPSEISFW
jgi:hypothetical protein